MAISNDDVRHVARLANLQFDDAGIQRMAEELSVIIDSIGKVAELDLDEVPPTTHVLDVVNVLEDDVPHTSLPPEKALANAPGGPDGGFRVPQMRS